MKDYINKQIGSYLVTNLISDKGGFGIVWQGKHIVFDDRPNVAIKILKDQSGKDKQKHLTLALREARLLDTLKHPYILPIIDANTVEDDIPYLITEFAPGGSLKDRIQKNAPHLLTQETIFTILTQVGQALHYAHQRGVVHRDLKPDNILFNSKGEALLADFGIAVVLNNGITKTSSNSWAGTPIYMSPEQFQGTKTAKIDQYALACIAYELLTGHSPFESKPKYQNQWIFAHTYEKPLPPTHYNTSIPKHVEIAILGALQKQREDRYENIGAFLVALGASPKLFMRIQEDVPIIASTDAIEIPMPSGATIEAYDPTKEMLQQFIEEGRELFRKKKYTEAIQKYEQVIKYNPKLAEAYYLMGQALKDLVRPWQALAAYNQALYLEPNYAQAHLGKGAIYAHSLNESEKALLEYQEATRLSPKDAAGYYEIGIVLSNLGRYNDALSAFEAAIGLAPNALHIYYNKGDILDKIDCYHDALEIYNRIIQRFPNEINAFYKKIDLLQRLGHFDQAIETYNEMITRMPDTPDLYYKKIGLLLSRKQFNDAILTYTELIRRLPYEMDAYTQKINLLLRLQRNNEAIEIYNQIILIFPRNIAYYNQKIKLLVKLKKYAIAINMYQETIKSFPEAINFYTDLIALFLELKSFDEAIMIYDQLATRVADPSEIYSKKLQLLKKIENNDEAVKVYDQLLGAIPSSRKLKIYYDKIKFLRSLERNREAIATCDAGIQLFPNKIELYYLKIELYRIIEDDVSAIYTHNQIIGLYPNDEKGYYRKIQLLDDLEMYEAAIKVCDQVIDYLPKNAQAYRRKGEMLKKLGDDEQEEKKVFVATLPHPIQILWRRFFPNTHYIEALAAYNQALYFAPTAQNATSLGEVLHLLGKENLAEKYSDQVFNATQTSTHPITKALQKCWYWFPFLLNAPFIILFSLFLHSSLSTFVTFVEIMANILTGISTYLLVNKINNRYNIYNACWLFLLTLFICVDWIVLYFISSITLGTMLFIYLFIFITNAALFLHIDIQGIQETLKLVPHSFHALKKVIDSTQHGAKSLYEFLTELFEN